MAHMTNKKRKMRENRGETFHGFAPKIEDNITIKMRKAEKKHKKDLTREFC